MCEKFRHTLLELILSQSFIEILDDLVSHFPSDDFTAVDHIFIVLLLM